MTDLYENDNQDLTLKCRGKDGKKKGKIKRQIGYRTATTIYPCFLPDLGEFDRS